MADLDPIQAEVAAFLADAATHALTPGAVKRIDTHAAMVFLAGERAYKVKRAVRYPYLDFSTLAKRAAACRAEIEANRPFTPELYEGVTPIVRRGGKLALGGEGETVEWAVVMRRFDENATLDHVAAQSGISDDVARALAETVAAAHGRAPKVAAKPWTAALGNYVKDEIAGLRAAPDLIDPATTESLARALAAELDRLKAFLAARGEAGFVRRGHGDLHLGNVALIDGRPVPFDALEFDPVVATGDVLYDLAFLLMDLLARKLDRAASIVFNRYLIAAGRDENLDALTALPFFLALRAAIRARVALDRRGLAQGDVRAKAGQEARDYAALALRLATPPPPRLVAIGGLSGTGKSTLAMALAPFIAPAPGAVVIRSDIERKRLAGVAETGHLPESAYSAEATVRVYARLDELARRALRAGHSAIVDAVHGRPDERAATEAVALAAGARFNGLWLAAGLDDRLARLGARKNDASDADARVARAQEKYAVGEITWQRIDAAAGLPKLVARARDLIE
jgi:aminoglycoside phosphotransferase family enzyme/predicted kinase